jgi:arginine-tRNA-protein transferase
MRCPYLPDRTEQLVFTHLGAGSGERMHGVLAQAGFRRSHNIAYRPDCPSCNACVPVRVRARDFLPSRSQKRNRSLNKESTSAVCNPQATQEQFDLFVAYQQSRHDDGTMAKMDFADYQAMVEDTPIKTFMVEHRDAEGRLIACALSDVLADGLSMVYSFFDPAEGRRGLGSFMILDHIARAPTMGLDYVYLGYWIAEAPKMAYKARFAPLESLGGSGWKHFSGSASPS